MTDDATVAPCARKGCTCEVPAGQTYCGPFCANASNAVPLETQETGCACGHEQCHASATAVQARLSSAVLL